MLFHVKDQEILIYINSHGLWNGPTEILYGWFYHDARIRSHIGNENSGSSPNTLGIDVEEGISYFSHIFLAIEFECLKHLSLTSSPTDIILQLISTSKDIFSTLHENNALLNYTRTRLDSFNQLHTRRLVIPVIHVEQNSNTSSYRSRMRSRAMRLRPTSQKR